MYISSAVVGPSSSSLVLLSGKIFIQILGRFLLTQLYNSFDSYDDFLPYLVLRFVSFYRSWNSNLVPLKKYMHDSLTVLFNCFKRQEGEEESGVWVAADSQSSALDKAKEKLGC